MLTLWYYSSSEHLGTVNSKKFRNRTFSLLLRIPSKRDRIASSFELCKHCCSSILQSRSSLIKLPAMFFNLTRNVCWVLYLSAEKTLLGFCVFFGSEESIWPQITNPCSDSPKKNTPYPTGYCAGKNIENCCSFGCFIKAMDRIFMGLPRKAYKSPPARDLQAFLVLYQHSKWV